MPSNGDLRGSWRTDNPELPVGTVLQVERDGEQIRVRWFAEVPVKVVTADASGFLLSLSGREISVHYDIESDALVLVPSTSDDRLILRRVTDARPGG